MSGIGLLCLNQPTKGLQPRIERVTMGCPIAAQNHRVGKFCIIVGGDWLEPLPFL